jgi:putative addiction module component (TIGR02574 family)
LEVAVARNFAEIQRELSEMSPEDRAKLALALVESLEPEDEGDIAEAWRLEAERRYEQYKRGEVQAIPGDEVFARIRSRLRLG